MILCPLEKMNITPVKEANVDNRYVPSAEVLTCIRLKAKSFSFLPGQSPGLVPTKNAGCTASNFLPPAGALGGGAGKEHYYAESETNNSFDRCFWNHHSRNGDLFVPELF